MNRILIIMMFLHIGVRTIYAQQNIQLQVLSSKDSLPIVGATVQLNKDKPLHADRTGTVFLSMKNSGMNLQIRHLSFQAMDYKLSTDRLQKVYLMPNEGEIEEVQVVSTGYFKAPKERLSGSYTYIDNKLLNRSASPNLLDRLEGVANGLQFDRGALTKENVEGSPLLRVRGTSTILSDNRPLIVVDDFPFEGDIRSINPNDVESVTLLKDAAAASIWGARAGNGVIVINMKKSGWDQKPSISFQTSFRHSPRPDLYFNQNVVNPSTMMDLQELLFNKKSFPERYNTQIPLYVELLIQKRDGKITEEDFQKQVDIYRNSDIRADALKYIYRPSQLQQYNLSLSGGAQIYRYNLTANLADNKSRIIGQGNKNYGLNFTNSFQLHKNLELEGFVRYNANLNKSNSISLSSISNNNLYLPLRDSEGNNLSVMLIPQTIRYANQLEAESVGLLNWEYKPIDELYENKLRAQDNQVTLGTNLHYKLPFGLGINASYYYYGYGQESSTLHTEQSYYSRDLVNRFTQTDGSKIIPEGAVYFFNAPLKKKGHYLRLLSNYSRGSNDGFRIDALAGMEASAVVSTTGFPFAFFGYDEKTEIGMGQQLFTQKYYTTRPGGVGELLPIPYASPSRNNDRNWSGYANTGLQWRNRYVLNGSIRWDASNLLGVETNARAVALWSLGGAWNIHQEEFFKVDRLSSLKLRTTYGSAGNINKSQGHLPVISWRDDMDYRRPYSVLSTPGNPNLRWEQVNTFNVGVDWAMNPGFLGGSFEYYNKHAKDLLSTINVDPTTGVSAGYLQNYANMRTEGVDISLQSSFNLGGVKLQQNVLFNYSRNWVTNIDIKPSRSATDYLYKPNYDIGKSVDLLYAIPSYGLSPEDGSLLLKDREGNWTKEYAEYNKKMKFEDIVVAGFKIAPYNASYRLGVEWKGINVNALLIGKFGHVARRNSMGPGVEYARGNAERFHMDYYKRWQKPGDEKETDVPAAIDAVNLIYSNIYVYSTALIMPLDYIAFRDVNLSYSFSKDLVQKMKVRSLEIFTSINQLGVVWKKNKFGIHPEYPNTAYPSMKEFYFGLRFQI